MKKHDLKKDCFPVFPYMLFTLSMFNPFLFTGLICLGKRFGAVPHTDRPPDQDKFPNLRIISMGWERAAQFCHLRQHPPGMHDCSHCGGELCPSARTSLPAEQLQELSDPLPRCHFNCKPQLKVFIKFSPSPKISRWPR